MLLYVLLALSVVVSLFGMVNALVLTVFERTREIGMMRAVGMTRRQVRRMVRHESIITALIGAGLGLPVGLFVAALVTHALASSRALVLAVPSRALAAFVARGDGGGPARRRPARPPGGTARRAGRAAVRVTVSARRPACHEAGARRAVTRCGRGSR